MSKITVKFNKEEEQVKMPSLMPLCTPFVARNKLLEQLVVLIRAGDTLLFFSADGSCSYALEEEFSWVDDNYEVLPNEKATVILEV